MLFKLYLNFKLINDIMIKCSVTHCFFFFNQKAIIQNFKCPASALQLKLMHDVDLMLMNVSSRVNFNIR